MISGSKGSIVGSGASLHVSGGREFNFACGKE